MGDTWTHTQNLKSEGSDFILAEAYIYLGEHKKAEMHANEVLKIEPNFLLQKLSKIAFYKDPSNFEKRLDVLREAGLK